ncbi:MAG: EAL domain-containing protein [Eubacterium sp.]|nr:EAL domain-containing protein [Eubacterium sp.]
MADVRDEMNPFGAFTDKMSGGAMIYSADAGHKFYYANDYLIKLFECDDYDDFLAFTGGSFDGMVNDTELTAVLNEIGNQVKDPESSSGYVFYNIRTKKGNIRRIVNHMTLVHDEKLGDIYYAYVFIHRLDNMGSDYDIITGLYRKPKFQKKVAGLNRQLCDIDSSEYVIVYLNLVNFKFLNINKGIAAGDGCLKTVSDILRRCFPDAILSRLSDDHFAIFTKYHGVLEAVEAASRAVKEAYGGKSNIIGKFGIYRFIPNRYFDVESALSLSKFACDYIKHDNKLDIIEYSESIAERVNTSDHVIKMVDDAIANEWIKVYFQPVVRTLTGELCGMESLVRWDDPELGFLLPDRFVGVLEKDRQIQKIDCYVVEKVCRTIHERIQAGKPVVPVSINFSRIDFVMCNMLEVVEDAVERNDIPRDYIHIEITESMIASDEELMRRVIEDFRNAGYEIWMDDFGSGYSSLTLLKDYQFDMLKFDMRFLTPFTEKAKDIMRSTVSMAKDIGIATLAEGVETKEQIEFLREIGCGKLQGYYYGRPEEIDVMFGHLLENGVEIEKRKWRSFYEAASKNVRSTDNPLEIIEDDGKNFRTLFMNKKYREQIFDEELELQEIDERLYHSGSPLGAKYREFANLVESSGKPQSFFYTGNGNYLSLNAELLAEFDGRYILKCSLINLSKDIKIVESDRLDKRIRELNTLFENVLVLDLNKDDVFPLIGGVHYAGVKETHNQTLSESIDRFIEKYVFPSEKTRNRDFIKLDTLSDRVRKSEKGYIAQSFRILQVDGSYAWKEILILEVAGTEGKEFLFCVKPFVSDACNIPLDNIRRDGADPDMDLKETEYAKLWNNLVWNTSIKMFWKDKNRRFKGASQSFIDFFGLRSVEDIVDKTDEDMRWYIEDDRFKSHEEEVIYKGVRVKDARGQCIVKGVMHSIITNKMPIYDNGEIVGLFGYFIDSDEELARVGGATGFAKIDNVTGLMNAHAFTEFMMDYALEYNEKGRNYGMILLNSSRHSRITESYGASFGDKVLKRLGEEIAAEAGRSCVVARTRDAVFSLLTYVEDKESLNALAERLKNRLNSITNVADKDVTIRIKSAALLRSDEGITDENIYGLAMTSVL